MATRTSKYDFIRGKEFCVSCDSFQEMWAMMAYMKTHGFECYFDCSVNEHVITFSIPER